MKRKGLADAGDYCEKDLHIFFIKRKGKKQTRSAMRMNWQTVFIIFGELMLPTEVGLEHLLQ